MLSVNMLNVKSSLAAMTLSITSISITIKKRDTLHFQHSAKQHSASRVSTLRIIMLSVVFLLRCWELLYGMFLYWVFCSHCYAECLYAECCNTEWCILYFYAECNVLLLHWVPLLNVVMLSGVFLNCYAECHCAKCCYAECHYSECCCADCRAFIVMLSVNVVVMQSVMYLSSWLMWLCWWLLSQMSLSSVSWRPHWVTLSHLKR